MPERMTMRTLPLSALEKMLKSVNKPGRYIGNEINMIRKDPQARNRTFFALVYPDLYDLGMANLSLKILYEILNRIEDVAAERAFLPDADMEREMRKRSIPLFTLENRVFLKDCAFIGFTIQSELTATNILHTLHLSGIPLLARHRKEHDPIVVGGGPALFNPEPYADFFDFFLLGDAEEVLPEVVAKRKDYPLKQAYLRAISSFPGIYVPAHWGAASGERKRFLLDQSRDAVQPATVKDLNRIPFPVKQTVPLINIPQNRAILEVARGCLNNCRFCQAGYFYRPLRERSPENVIDTAVAIIKSTGYQQMSLLSLSISNYDRLFEMLPKLNKALKQEKVNISLPSLRIDAFDPEILSSFKDIKKTGLTFALESMSPSVRAFLNKELDYPAFLEIIRKVVERKWRSMKIYLMYGFPFEHELEETIRGMNEFSSYVRELNPRVDITFHLTPFIPKPGTPLQWVKPIAPEKAKEFLGTIKRSVRFKNVSIKWHSIEMAHLETVMTRADRDFSSVLLIAWKQGARFDSWDDKFRYDIWKPLLESYAGRHPLNEDAVLPWDHIDFGFKKGFFKREYEKALSSIPTESCKDKGCYGCAVCGNRKAQNIIHRKQEAPEKPSPESSAAPDHALPFHVLEIFFTKLGLVKYLSHLDVIHIMEKALNISGLEIRRSFGFNPHKKVSFQAPLSLGFESECEVMAVQVMEIPDLENLKRRFNAWLPEGLKVISIVADPPRKMSQEFNKAEYEITLPFPHNLRMFFGPKPEAICSLRRLSLGRFLVVSEVTKNPVKAYGIPVDRISRVVKKRYL
jgi:radical SAM family uncharacterized protein